MKKYALLLGALILSATMLQACGSEPDHSKDATRNISRENADKGGLNALPNDNSLKADESSSPSSTEQDGSSNVASQEPDHESDPGSAKPDAPSTPALDGATAFSVAYHDSYKTIVLFNESQIKEVTGLQLNQNAVGSIINKLKQEKTWAAQAPLASYSNMIAEAAGNESNRIHSTLNKMIQGKASGLRLYISHSKHNQTAHFGTNNGNH